MSLTKEDTRAGSKCLVCYAPFARSKLKRSSWDDSSSGLPSSALDKQLSAMFVLQNLLEVPSERLQLFLTCLGNPALWVWVCPKCNGNVRNAMAVYEELLKVFERFMVLKGRIVEEIRESCGKAPSTSEGGGEMFNLFGNKLWITDQSRHYVVTHDYGPFKNPFVSGDAQARQLTKSSSSTVLWVESKKKGVISNSSPSSPMVDPLQVEEQDSIKMELEDEEGYCDDSLQLDYGELEDESSRNNYIQDYQRDEEDESRPVRQRPIRKDAVKTSRFVTRRRKSRASKVISIDDGNENSDNCSDTDSDIQPRKPMKPQDAVEMMKLELAVRKTTAPPESIGLHRRADASAFENSDESDFDEAKILEGDGVYFRITGSGRLKCIKCGEFHKTMKSFIKHVRLHKSSPHKCNVCRRVYLNQRTLRIHTLKYHRETVGDIAPRKSQFEATQFISDEVDNSNQENSDHSDFDEAKLQEGKHYMRTPYNLFKCLKCFDRTHTMPSLIKHLELHKKSPHQCSSCQKVFTTESFLQKHVQLYHVRSSKNAPMKRGLPVQRPVKYSRLNTGQRKMPSYDYELELKKNPNCYDKCTVCDITMLAKRMKAHMKQWHGSTSNVKVEDETATEYGTPNPISSGPPQEVAEGILNECTCTKCKKQFKTLDLLKNHIELHKTSPFHCHICIEVFTNSALLTNHLWLSHNRKDVRLKDKLRQKLNPITKSGLIRCMKCLRCFTATDIGAHNELHETSPHSCTFCGNVFIDEVRLRGHLSRFHRQLYERMKSINPTNPTAVIIELPDQTNEEESENSEDDADDNEMDGAKEWVLENFTDTDIQLSLTSTAKRARESKLANGSRYTCPLCNRFFFIAEDSEDLCNHLENCPGLQESTVEGSSSHQTQELRCPICTMFKCSVLNKSEFGEHLLNCTIKDPSDSEGNETGNRIPLTRRLFECAVCPTKFYFQLNGFLEHYKHHTVRMKMLKCTECSRRYPNRDAINKHWGNCHTKLKETTATNQRFTKDIAVPTINWWCSVCSEKFQEENERDLHLQIKHPEYVPEKAHICSTCQKEYACPDELSLHKGTSHVTITPHAKHIVSCDVCAQLCRNQHELDVHKRKKHRVNMFICDICATECNSQTTLVLHKQLHDDVKKHQCDECSSSFTTSQYLRHHTWREHTPLDKNVNPLVCKYCDRLMHSPHYLSTHIALVHEKKFTVSCHICGFGAAHESRMKKHMISAHKIGEPKRWKCTIEGCDKVFRTPRDLESHKNKHEGTPQYACDHCGKGFYNKQYMNRHKQIHTNAETLPYVCEICAKRFPVRNYLYIHMKSHRKKGDSGCSLFSGS